MVAGAAAKQPKEVTEPVVTGQAIPKGYKRTELGVIPEDWEVVKLGEYIQITSGESPSKFSFRDFGVPYFKVDQLNNAIKYQTETPYYVVNSPIVERGSIIFPKRGASIFQNKIRILFHDSFMDTNLMALTITSSEYSNEYLYYILGYLGLANIADTTSVPQINNKHINPFILPKPPLPEQQAIADALSDVDSWVASLDALITKKRALKTAAMQQLLTGQTRLAGFSGKWRQKRVDEFTECLSGGTPSTLIPQYWSGTIRWMSSGELNYKIVKEVEGRITEAGLVNSATKMIPLKCVLIGLAGQGKTRGTVAINLIELCTNQSIAAILPSKEHISEYLCYNLNQRYDELRALSTGDGGRGGLNLGIIKSLLIPFPKIEEQAAIATILSDMDEEIATLETKRDKAKALKQGMM